MKAKNVKMGLLSCFFVIFILSCKEEAVQPAQPTPEGEKAAVDTSASKDQSNVNKEDTIYTLIGTGSGTIVVKDVSDQNYEIKAGTYNSIRLENLKNVKISGLNNVKFTSGSSYIGQVDGLHIQGITVENIASSAFNIYEFANNITFEDITFRNISNTVIRFQIEKKYDGKPQSYSKNIHLNKINAENIGSLIVTRGQIQNNGFTGLIKGFKLTNSTIKNSPNLGNGIYLGCVENYEISHNIITNVNKSESYPNGNNNHNGIFHVNGSGKIFNNKITNFQGNAARAWLYSIDDNRATVEIYNNIVHNSTRYSAFELQVTPWMEKLANFKPANAIVYNNTVGRLNTGEPKFYQGRVIDIYQTFGNVEVYNNLYFHMRDNLVSLNQSSPQDTKVKETNNKYFKNATDAVTDLQSFKSKISGIGAKL